MSYARHRDIRVYVLDRRDTSSECHREPVRCQDDFELGNYGEEVGKIEVAEMRDPENPTLHGPLAVRDNRAEASAELLDDHAGVHARRSPHGCNRCGRRVRGE